MYIGVFSLDDYDWACEALDYFGYLWFSHSSGTKIMDFNLSYYTPYGAILIVDPKTRVVDFISLHVFENVSLNEIMKTENYYTRESMASKGVTIESILVFSDNHKESKFNLPNHYDFQNLKQSSMEIINIVAEANSGGVFKIGWYLANTLKYLFRFRRKNGVADLKKARDYIDRLIDYFESEGENVD